MFSRAETGILGKCALLRLWSPMPLVRYEQLWTQNAFSPAAAHAVSSRRK